MIMTKKVRFIAYYLPQFHPIPENDEWWGKGFTEWTNVTKAKPLFKDHYQPRFPSDLGYYDLRVPEVREAQSEMARNYGIEGFCYYHYWFGNGRQILERPFNDVLTSNKPDYPFCLCWANESWRGIWFGDNRTLIEQKYFGKEDIKKHFTYLLKAFSDERYMKVDEKPIFQILTPKDLPNSIEITDSFRELAYKHGLKGLFLVAGYRAAEGWNPLKNGFDAVVSSKFVSALHHKSRFSLNWLINRVLHTKLLSENEKLQSFFKRYYRVLDYKEVIDNLKIEEDFPYDYYPCVIPNWDNTPRSGIKGYVLTNSTPDLFKAHLTEAVDYVQKYAPQHQIVFIKSWNEWAEGNYLEPDKKYGTKYLEVIKSCAAS